MLKRPLLQGIVKSRTTWPSPKRQFRSQRKLPRRNLLHIHVPPPRCRLRRPIASQPSPKKSRNSAPRSSTCDRNSPPSANNSNKVGRLLLTIPRSLLPTISLFILRVLSSPIQGECSCQST